MSGYLLDVNVLIALLDPSHVHHDRAHLWFQREGGHEWMSCPTTQNGVLRIVSNPRYSNSQPMRLVIESLASLLAVGSHTFVPDAFSPLDPDFVLTDRLLNSNQVTETYLVALAGAHGAQLATFDSRIVTSAVHDGTRSVRQIP